MRAATRSPVYSAGGFVPESASIGTDGNVYFTGVNGPSGNAIYQLNTTTGAVNFFAFSAAPNLTYDGAGRHRHLESATYYYGALRYDYTGNFLQQVGFFGTNQAQTDAIGNVWTPNPTTMICSSSTSSATTSSATFVPGADRPDDLGRGQPERSSARHPGLLLVRPHRRARARRSWPRA